MYRIDDELKEFIEGGVALCVGTADPSGKPNVLMGWGPRVGESRTGLTIFLDRARADRAIENLARNGRIAVTFGDPVTYRSVQLKGQMTATGDADDADLAWVQRHREAFAVTTAMIGDPPGAIRNLWMNDLVRVEFDVDAAFDQTPGPDAGKPL